MSKQTIVEMVNQLEMVGFIKSNGTASRFVGILIDTPVVKIKAGNPFPGLRKVARKIGIINANFNTSVRTRIASILGVEVSEVEYKNGETWYEHFLTGDGKTLPLVHNKKKQDGKFYLQYFPMKSTHKYVMPDGRIVPDEEVKPWLYAESKKPAFKPAVISIDLANVRDLRASGVIVQMEDYDEAEKIISS